MIILDTNVISELMKKHPDPAVIAWTKEQKPTNLAITAIAIAEIQRGISLLPKGKRRDNLEDDFKCFVEKAFIGRILPFDEDAAYLYGEIAAKRVQSGFNIDAVDLMIASIVKNYGASIATRNIKDFKDCGFNVINPWAHK